AAPSRTTIITRHSRPGIAVSGENRSSVSIGTRTNTRQVTGAAGASSRVSTNTKAGVSTNAPNTAGGNQRSNRAPSRSNAGGMAQQSGTANQSGGASSNR